MPEPSPQNPAALNATELQLAAWDHMDAENFEEQDRDYILQQFRVRPVNRILAGGSSYADPFEWQVALDRARAEEKAEQERLVSEHGYPCTEGLEWREAHQKRLRFLMTKYPDADWDLLLRGQFEGRDRKPAQPKVRKVTIHVIEQAKTRLIAMTQQLEELKAYGDSVSVVQSLQASVRRVRNTVEGYGFDADALLEEHRSQWEPIPLDKTQTGRLVQQVAVLEELIGEMESVACSGESELLVATRRVLAVYRDTLTGFGVDLPAGESPTESAGTFTPAVTPVTTPVVAPASDPGVDPEPRNPVSTSVASTGPGDEKTGELLTASEAAKIVGIAYTTMLTELKSGRFPFANRVGNQWRISRKGLNDWLEGHRSDVETLRKQDPAVPKSRSRKAEKPRYIRPDGKTLSF